MSISREQIADLRPGDAVKLHDSRWGGITINGHVRESNHGLCVGPLVIADVDGADPYGLDGPVQRSLTVVDRAPLYVNHDRDEPVYGDVVRPADDDLDASVYVWLPHMDDDAHMRDLWHAVTSNGSPILCGRQHLPARLRLLVDGETGQVVS